MNNINWDSVIKEIESVKGEVRTVGVDFYKNANGQFDEIANLWKEAGYDSHNVEWINFYPSTHFDSSVEQQFAAQVGLTPIRSWISCVRPGMSAPWHQDVDDNMLEYQQLGNLVRYTCHIAEPAHGQLMLIEKESFYMIPKGTVSKWPKYMAWHGASNCGFKNHYLYHFLGYENI